LPIVKAVVLSYLGTSGPSLRAIRESLALVPWFRPLCSRKGSSIISSVT